MSMTTNGTPPNTLAVFDFDGTLSYHDSFIPFLRFAFGNVIFFQKMRAMLKPSLRYVLGGCSRDQLKAQLINTYLTGVEVAWLTKRAEVFCQQTFTTLMRPAGCEMVRQQKQTAHTVTLCSASPELILQPFANKLDIALIGTKLISEQGRLTGEIEGKNCRGAEKIVRLEQQYGDLTHYYLKAWGDSQGDYELLRAANEPHWRPFRPSWRTGRSPL